MKRSAKIVTTISTLGVMIIVLVILDVYDVPSKVETLARRYYADFNLYLHPIVIDDEDIFESLSTQAAGTGVPEGTTAQRWLKYALYKKSQGPILTNTGEIRRLVTFLKENFPDKAEQVVAIARLYAEGEIAPYELNVGELGPDYSWANLERSISDPVVRWEANTLQHLVLMAEAHILTADDHFLDAIEGQLAGWVDRNPIGTRANWRATMEVSIRLTNLIVLLELLSAADAEAKIFPMLVKTIFAHAQHVHDTIDKPRKINNHAIFSAIGLYFYSVSFPELSQSADWRVFSEHRILEELDVQYTENGVHVEYSFAYHKVLLDAFLSYLIAKNRLVEEPAIGVMKKVERQLDFLAAVTRPDGHIFLVGDSDDHHFIRLDTSRFSDALPTLYLGSLLSPDFGPSGANVDALWRARWTLGPGIQYDETDSSNNVRVMLSKRRDASVIAYEDEGFFRFDDKTTTLFGTFSKFGQAPKFAGHSHSDIGSFSLWHNNQPLIVDAGTLTYRQSLRTFGVSWRDFFRSSMAHNTVTVDGASQGIIDGEFGFENWPDSALSFWTSDRKFAVVGGVHNAYKNRIGQTVRIFMMTAKSIVVIDWFPDSIGRHSYSSQFVFADKNWTLHDGQLRSPAAVVSWALSNDTTEEFLTASTDPIGGWRSETYGSLLETGQLRLDHFGDGPVVVVSKIEMTEEASLSPMVHKIGTRGFALKLDSGGSSWIVLLNNDVNCGRRDFNWGSWSSDARIAIIQIEGERSAVLVGGRNISGPSHLSKVQMIPGMEICENSN